MNNTNYPDELYKKLLKYSNRDNSSEGEKEEELKLFDYQKHIYNYMTKTENKEYYYIIL